VAEIIEEMSPEVAAAVYGGLVGGVLAMFGVLAGMFVERRLQECGKVRCIVSDWDLREAGPLGRAVCSFEVDLFNERHSPTGLRDIYVTFLRDDEQRPIVRLKDSVSHENLEVMNLPSRRWVHANLYAFFKGEELQTLSDFRRVELVGYFPDGREFKQTIVERKDFIVSRKRAGASWKSYAQPWWRSMFGHRD
jgi:hypothetical protein